MTDHDQFIQTVYPSIAALGAGRALGWLYESIPLRIGVIKLSHLLFPLPTSPIAAFLYLGLKVFGRTYRLTTKRVCIVRGSKKKVTREIALREIARIEVRVSAGQRFFRAGDLLFWDSEGLERLRLAGVPQPEMFRWTILETRDAWRQTEEALGVVAARAGAGVGR